MVGDACIYVLQVNRVRDDKCTDAPPCSTMTTSPQWTHQGVGNAQRELDAISDNTACELRNNSLSQKFDQHCYC